jgi:hypothetical protein
MASTIGSLQIDILANIARLQSDMDKATRSVGGAMSSIEKSVGFAQKALLGLGVGVSFAALIGQVNKAVDTLAKLDDMAQKTGSSVENLSRLQKVASQFGQDFGSVDAAISKLARGLSGIDDAGGKTSKALQAIGISAQFVKSNDPSQVMVQVAKNLQNYRDGAEKAAVATDLFGKAGVEILPYLNDLAENVDKYTGSTAEAAAKAAAFQDALGGFKVKFEEASTSIATSLLPAFDQIISKFNEAVKEGGLLLGIIKGIGEIGKITLFGTDRSKQENMYNITLPNSMAQIGRELKDQNLTSQERIKKQVELNFLAKEYNALAIQLGKVEKASPYVAGTGNGKPAIVIETEEQIRAREAAAKAAKTLREKENEEKLRDIQKQIDLEDELKEASYKAEKENLDKQDAAREKLRENAFEMDQKFIKALDKLETKFLDERTEKQIKAAEEVAKKQEELAKDINRSLTDALLRGFESGKDFAQNFKDTLVNMFQTLILRPTIEAVINGSGLTKLISGVTGGVASVFSGGAAAGVEGASGGGLGGLVSQGKSLFGAFTQGLGNFQTNFASSIADFGNFISGSGAKSLGGLIATNSTLISNVAPYAGALLQLASGNAKGAAFTAAGAAIGSFVPVIGTALGGLIGGVVGGLFGGKKQPPRTVTQLGDVNEQFSGTLGGVLKTFGGAGNVSTNARYSGRSGGSGYGFLDANFDGQQINFAKRFKGAYGEASLKEFIEKDVFGVIKQAIQRSSIDGNFKGVYSRTQSMGEINSVTQAAQSLKANNEQLIKIYGVSSEAVAWHTNAMGLSTEQFLQYTNAVINAANSTKSVGQALIEFKTSLSSVYGGTIPATIEQFDAKMKSLAGNPQGFANLLGIRDQFVQFTQSINGLKGNVRGALFGIVSDAEKQAMMNADLAKLFGDLNRDVPGSIQELIALGKSIDYTTAEGLNLAAVFPSLVQAFNETKGAVDGLLNSLRGVNNFKTLVDFQRYQGVANNYGTSFANNYVDNLPSYDVGTSFVPNDGPAMIHQGERILTASENRDLSTMNAALISEMRGMRTEMAQMRRDSFETARSTKKTSDLLQKVTRDGEALLTEAV